MATHEYGSAIHETDDLEEKSARNAPSGVNELPHRPKPAEQDDQAKPDTPSSQDGHSGPEGGFDSTPIPSPSPGTIGYTVKFTIHRATNLAVGDAHTLSSDPYCLAQLNTGLPMRHKEDPNLRLRTPTIRRNTNPEWNEEWIVANVPSSGFKLKIRVYDEDLADHDDILGKVHINEDTISEDWPGVNDQPYQLRIRDSSKRAVSMRAVAKSFRLVEHMRGEIFVSIKVLGRTKEDGQNGRAYTVGPCRWIRHYSPLLGRITHTKDSGENRNEHASPSGADEKRIQHYNFQANQIQLPGPVPAQLYHRFVEFKPWVKRMFTTKGFQGVVLGKALHHQHSRVYNFDRTTVWGRFEEAPSIEMSKKFLDLVHYDQGGRIFTYVLTLDALWRFTETGKEFGIDMLSKHTMHSDVSIYIAFSGEFFIRRIKRDRNGRTVSQDVPHTHPSQYELIIDNDSGTYRPNAKMLPLLAAFLSQALPGLHVKTLDCQADAEEMAKMKNEQRERKKKEGDNIVYTQEDSDSLSSSEGERLDAIEAGLEEDEEPVRPHVSIGGGHGSEYGHLGLAAKDIKRRRKAKGSKGRKNFGLKWDQFDSDPQ